MSVEIVESGLFSSQEKHDSPPSIPVPEVCRGELFIEQGLAELFGGDEDEGDFDFDE